MARIRRRSKIKKYNYNKDRKKAWKNSKKMPTVRCSQLKNAWDEKKSTKQNMLDMGLSYDPNATLPLPKTKNQMISANVEEMEINEIKQRSSWVVQELEAEASLPQKRTLRLSQPEMRYCIYMMDKYGEDYKAMARDQRNYYQDTPKQIKNKIKTFKNTPEQYSEYLKSKTDSMEAS